VRVVAIDPGERRVGVAVSDDDASIALPRPAIVVRTPEEALAGIVGVARAEEATTVVLGLPIDMSGREGLAARKSRVLASKLKAQGLSVVLWDERGSSVAASRDLRRAGLSAKEQRGKVDSAAACLLLQSYLDAGEAARKGR
jgi:putative Holliday junction resolvase